MLQKDVCVYELSLKNGYVYSTVEQRMAQILH